MEILIRKACAADSCEIWEICRDDMGYDCSPELVSSKLQRLDPDHEAVFAAESENRVIGFIHVEKYDTLYFETLANILGLAVRSNCRRNGVGKSLWKLQKNGRKKLERQAFGLIQAQKEPMHTTFTVL
ncbi:MAG: GNAT family N-acetyltransferase [Oscillospiraceae bacterium]